MVELSQTLRTSTMAGSILLVAPMVVAFLVSLILVRWAKQERGTIRFRFGKLVVEADFQEKETGNE